MDNAQQKTCDRLWELFDFLCTAAELEANQENINAPDLEALIRTTSQAGINYRYHANTTVGSITSTPHPAVAWRNAD